MLGAVASHEFMVGWMHLTNEGQLCLPQYFSIQWCIHDAFKDVNSSGTSLTDPCPDMYFDGMLCSR